MARRPDPPPLASPTLSKADGRRKLTILMERGATLLKERPLKEGQFLIWNSTCLEAIKATFGEATSHDHIFIGQGRIDIAYGNDYDDPRREEARNAEQIQRKVQVLQSLIEQLDLDIGLDESSQTAKQCPQRSFWEDIHPSIARIAKPRYEAGHYADSVEAALKEINTVIKEHVRRKTGQELDGASLMQKAFSPNAPIIVLDDLSTESGKSTQQGYMQIYAGAIMGIRNPKAHANVVIGDERARHFLYIASLLAFVFDERL